MAAIPDYAELRCNRHNSTVCISRKTVACSQAAVEHYRYVNPRVERQALRREDSRASDYRCQSQQIAIKRGARRNLKPVACIDKLTEDGAKICR